MRVITVTREDPMGGIPDSHEPVILSVSKFSTWRDAFDYICAYGVCLNSEHEEEIMKHDDTQFMHAEFINAGQSACAVNVHYDVRVDDIEAVS